MGNLRFEPKNFIVRLPKAYYQDSLDLSLSDTIWNFEANGLPQEGIYSLRLTFPESIDNAEISLDRINFKKLEISNSITEVQVTIDHSLLSFDIRLPDADDVTCPLRDIELIDSSSPQGKIENFDLYIRDTNLSACNLLKDWPASKQKIMAESFDLQELLKMRDEIVDWSASRQVLDTDDPHYGAVYSEEDKYSFTDAIYAARCFMKRFLQTEDQQWLKRAVAARDYSFRGQYRNTGDAGKDGAWASMGIIDDPEGKDFRRITDKWAQASGVDMNLILIESVALHEMGMPFTNEHLEQLRATVTWQIRNQICPGWFSHHEGMILNCINVNSLASSSIFAVQRMLVELTGCGLGEDVLMDAIRAYEHVLACQEAIGVVPYRRADYKRGGGYSCHNAPDNGIGLHSQMRLLRNPHSPFTFEELQSPLRRSAIWYLLLSRVHDGRIVMDFDPSEEYIKNYVGFGNFTWCRITMIDIISQLWDIIGDKEFWKQFVRAHLQTIRETLWNHDDPDYAPIKASVVPQPVVSWMQQAQWAAMVFDDLADRFGLLESKQEIK